ncbi:hypothetical protein E4U58_006435, partial [Claviceps cyperi]
LPRHFLTMLKNISVFIAALAVIGPVVQAQGSCTPGLNYCGLTLLQNGKETLP